MTDPHKRQYICVGLGEVLWDMFPDGKRLGGAPANFAYHASQLGHSGIVASAVGSDDAGAEVRRLLDTSGLCLDYLQTDPNHPTGTVQIQTDARGQPQYTITEGVAWDFLRWDAAWEELARKADAVCFGSLAQRGATSRQTIQNFLRCARRESLRIFDINLRQHYFTASNIESGMRLANVLKMNDEELPVVMGLLGRQASDASSSALKLMEDFDLEMVCVTRGEKGSYLVGREGAAEHPGFKVGVIDTVGAGDAFMAGVADGLLRSLPLARISDQANRLGSYVASCSGAMPRIDARAILAESGKT